MKKEVIFLLLVFLFPIISAQNITVDYPREVTVGEDFSFNISLVDFEGGIYDIKIDIIANGERVARILGDGKWKSTHYYVNDIISPGEEKEVTLKVLEYIGVANVTIKIRKSGEVSSEVFEGYTLDIVEAQTQQQENDTNQTDLNQSVDDLNYNENGQEEEETDQQNESSPQTGNQTPSNEPPSAVQGVIRLNPKVIKSEEGNENLEKNDYALYGFIVFCVFLAFLFLVRKIRSKNEFKA